MSPAAHELVATIERALATAGGDHPLQLDAEPARADARASSGWVALLANFVLAFGLLGVPLVGHAQQTKVFRVGFLLQASPPPGFTSGPFIKAMNEFGYVEGQNLVVDRRWAEGKNERFPSLAVDLVAQRPDVIVADSTPAAIAATGATTTIPIVIVNVSDPVASGLVASLARPGGNVTGVTDLGVELAAKSVDLIRAAVPKATRVAVLMSDNPVHPLQLNEIQEVAARSGLTVLPTTARSPEDFEEAFRSMAVRNAGAFILLGGAPFITDVQRDKIIQLAAKARLPGVYPARSAVEAGGLMSYGVDFVYRWRLAATYADKILKGARPADLPVQQPSELELVINLKTARSLGLTIPPSLLLRANQVIE